MNCAVLPWRMESCGRGCVLITCPISPALTNSSHESFSFPACQGHERIPCSWHSPLGLGQLGVMWSELSRTTLGMSHPVYPHQAWSWPWRMGWHPIPASARPQGGVCLWLGLLWCSRLPCSWLGWDGMGYQGLPCHPGGPLCSPGSPQCPGTSQMASLIWATSERHRSEDRVHEPPGSLVLWGGDWIQVIPYY